MAICKLTGKLATRETPYIAQEWFKPGMEPVEYSNVCQKLAIDMRNGLIATANCPKEFVAIKTFTVLPTEFYLWQKESGFELPPVEMSQLSEQTGRNNNYKVLIVEPVNQSKIFIDPEAPSSYQTISLNAVIAPLHQKQYGM